MLIVIKEKHRGKLTKVPLSSHDNATAQRWHTGQTVIYLNAYSTDLTPNQLITICFQIYREISVDRLFYRWWLQYAPEDWLKRHSESILFYWQWRTPRLLQTVQWQGQAQNVSTGPHNEVASSKIRFSVSDRWQKTRFTATSDWKMWF